MSFATTIGPVDSAAAKRRAERQEYWDQYAVEWKGRSRWGRYYHERLVGIYQFLVPPGQRVLELGCGRGDLLAALRPSRGVGVDFSKQMVNRARRRHPEMEFVQADVHDLDLADDFDVIILSDLINDLWDIQAVFERVRDLATRRTRIVLNFYSRTWQLPLALAKQFRLARPTLDQSWLTAEDTANLLALADLELLYHWPEILWPLRTPLVSGLCNRFLARIWPFRLADLCHFMVARRRTDGVDEPDGPSVSVVVPARNEAGNIAQILDRTPVMGRETEIIFVEGHSTDDTLAAIEEGIAAHPDRPSRLLRQTGKGKGDAVRLGFANARGDVLMILDADLTVPPEDLPRFYQALRSGKGEFINGVRLVYPMEQRAMRFLNLVGNKFFSLTFSWLLGQPIKDSLCGTKVLWRSDYELIAANRAYFGDFDPFGDFDLLFGAAKLKCKILDLPIRYRERTYGRTNIQRWKHGWLLLKMAAFAALRMKFV